LVSNLQDGPVAMVGFVTLRGLFERSLSEFGIPTVVEPKIGDEPKIGNRRLETNHENARCGPSGRQGVLDYRGDQFAQAGGSKGAGQERQHSSRSLAGDFD